MNNTHPLEKIRGIILDKRDWPQSIDFKQIKEGKIGFRVADSDSIYDAPAFFNPVMVLNRDLAILFGLLYAKKRDVKLRIFEPLAGIGVRAFRLASEIPEYIDEVVFCDFDEETTSIANYNLHQLKLENKLFQFKREAKSLALDLFEHRMKYHYIDLDPFGSPAPFIDSMWDLFHITSMIAVTATDMTALCGVYPKSCMRKYGAVPLNNHHTHETAARILIAMVVKSAARHERGVRPIFTASVDHYTKVFFKTKKGRGVANRSVSKIGFSYTCRSCSQIYYLDLTEHQNISCCGDLDKAGPLWTGNLFDKEWSEEAKDLLVNDELNLPSKDRILKLLDEAINAIGLHGYYSMEDLGRKTGTSQPPFDEFAEQIRSKGYRLIKSEFNKQSFRTDAPSTLIKSVIRELVESN